MRLSVGEHPADALARKMRKEAELNAAHLGVKIRLVSELRAAITLFNRLVGGASPWVDAHEGEGVSGLNVRLQLRLRVHRIRFAAVIGAGRLVKQAVNTSLDGAPGNQVNVGRGSL